MYVIYHKSTEPTIQYIYRQGTDFEQSWKIIAAIRYAYPGLVLLYFVVASTVTVCTLQTLSLKVKDQRVRRDIIIWLMLGVVCQYVSLWVKNAIPGDNLQMLRYLPTRLTSSC